jgi:hypothetical protein
MQADVDQMLEPRSILGMSFVSDPVMKKMAFGTGKLIDFESIIVPRHYSLSTHLAADCKSNIAEIAVALCRLD